ncbi:MAG: hypothetical protein U0457_15300 [Candidatus Sericytochromatia bacterium]
MPELYQEIDFQKGYEFLDGELNKIKIKSSSKNRRSDKLVKVYLKDGSEKYILIHIEVQGVNKKFLLKKGENEKSKQVVINGIKKGFSNDILSELTGLGIKEIEEI